MIVPRVLLDSLNELSPEQQRRITKLGIVGEVFVELPKAQDENAYNDLIKIFQPLMLITPLVVGPFLPSQAASAADWLNSGARRVIFRTTVDSNGTMPEECADACSSLPKERVIVLIEETFPMPGEGFASLLDSLQTISSGVLLSAPEFDEELLAGPMTTVIEAAAETRPKGFWVGVLLGEANVELPRYVEEIVGDWHGKGKDYPFAVVGTCSLPTSESPFETLSVARALCTCLVTDRLDGLYTTVVVDEFGVALGLVYSSDASIEASLAVGRGVYFSRSRNELWRKGDTSGAWQELLSIRMDCDNDALRFSVIQHGTPAAFCHRNTLTCWGHSEGLPSLFRTLQERQLNPPPGSYTQRLFNDRELLRNKLLEESQELIEAVEEGDKVHVAEEAADVTYFALVACCAGGANLLDVSRQLDGRSLKVKRRPGNAKAYRIAAAEAALGKKAE